MIPNLAKFVALAVTAFSLACLSRPGSQGRVFHYESETGQIDFAHNFIVDSLEVDTGSCETTVSVPGREKIAPLKMENSYIYSVIPVQLVANEGPESILILEKNAGNSYGVTVVAIIGKKLVKVFADSGWGHPYVPEISADKARHLTLSMVQNNATGAKTKYVYDSKKLTFVERK